VGPKPNQQTKSRKKQILMTKKKNDQSKNIFSLKPHHPQQTPSHLVSEAKQCQAWLVLGWEKDLQRRLLRDKHFKDKEGMLSRFKWSHSCQISQK
jgi:hypothetical protein